MVLNNKVFLPISTNILDTENISEDENEFTIPLKRTPKNQDRYDEMYCYLGKHSGFLFDITESKLNLVVRLNAIEQLDFSVSADFVEFRVEEVPEYLLEKHREQMSVVLLDEELVEMFPIVSGLFENEPSIEDLRIQVTSSIPKEYMQNTMLFSEEITQKGYHCVWVTEDFKKCVIAFIRNCKNPNELVKAYVIG